jgi:hypothetical protein
MFTTIEAEVDDKGQIQPKEQIRLSPGARLLITVLDPDGLETALLSESALATDWERIEEDAAWSHLTQG